MKNNYNYILNGIPHEINLNSSIKILTEPLDEKKILSNKFMIKIINDLLIYLNIDFCLINNTLLGQKIFSGVNIFEEDIEILIEKNNIKKILKEIDFLNNNDITITNYNKYLLLNTNFYNNIEVSTYIYLFEQENNNIHFENNNNEIINLNFYDIFPIKSTIFEEFEVSIPNKIDNVLLNCNIDLNFLYFKSEKILISKFLNNNQKIVFLFYYLLYLLKNNLIYF
mgnify:CR=1 FL=1